MTRFVLVIVAALALPACTIAEKGGTSTGGNPTSPSGPSTPTTPTAPQGPKSPAACTGDAWCIEGYTELDSSFDIINGVNIRNWPSTAKIVGGSWAGGYTIDFDKRYVWPTQYGGPGVSPSDPILFTIWAFVEKPTGGWLGSGFIQVWPARTDAGGPGSPCAQLPSNWWYPGGPWDAMRQYPFGAGKRIAIVVTSGNTRLNGEQTFKERSSVALVRIPSTC